MNVRPAVPKDVYALQGRLREADRMELAANHTDPSSALVQGLFRSKPHAWTVEKDGLVVGMFGVAPGLHEKFGGVWLLGSEELTQGSEFLRRSRAWLNRLSAGYDLLYNVVHEKNDVHIRWLKWLGFRFLRHVPPHHEFARIP